jgi:uncharacterized protein YbcI
MSSEISERGRQASSVSNAITRMHREHYGRGATTARTIIQRNYVVCFLEDIYTPVERTLIEAGRLEAVRETRNLFQDAMGPRFIEAVEKALRRKVIAFSPRSVSTRIWQRRCSSSSPRVKTAHRRMMWPSQRSTGVRRLGERSGQRLPRLGCPSRRAVGEQAARRMQRTCGRRLHVAGCGAGPLGGR